MIKVGSHSLLRPNASNWSGDFRHGTGFTADNAICNDGTMNVIWADAHVEPADFGRLRSGPWTGNVYGDKRSPWFAGD